MPSLVAAAVASLAGWVLDGLIQPYLGTGMTLVLTLAASSLMFFYATVAGRPAGQVTSHRSTL